LSLLLRLSSRCCRGSARWFTRVPRIYADAARTSGGSGEHQPARWRSERANVNALAERFGLPASAVAALGRPDRRWSMRKICRLNGVPYCYLVYAIGRGEISLYVRRNDDRAATNAPVLVGKEYVDAFTPRASRLLSWRRVLAPIAFCLRDPPPLFLLARATASSAAALENAIVPGVGQETTARQHVSDSAQYGHSRFPVPSGFQGLNLIGPDDPGDPFKRCGGRKQCPDLTPRPTQERKTVQILLSPWASNCWARRAEAASAVSSFQAMYSASPPYIFRATNQSSAFRAETSQIYLFEMQSVELEKLRPAVHMIQRFG